MPLHAHTCRKTHIKAPSPYVWETERPSPWKQTSCSLPPSTSTNPLLNMNSTPTPLSAVFFLHFSCFPSIRPTHPSLFFYHTTSLLNCSFSVLRVEGFPPPAPVLREVRVGGTEWGRGSPRQTNGNEWTHFLWVWPHLLVSNERHRLERRHHFSEVPEAFRLRPLMFQTLDLPRATASCWRANNASQEHKTDRWTCSCTYSRCPSGKLQAYLRTTTHCYKLLLKHGGAFLASACDCKSTQMETGMLKESSVLKFQGSSCKCYKEAFADTANLWINECWICLQNLNNLKMVLWSRLMESIAAVFVFGVLSRHLFTLRSGLFFNLSVAFCITFFMNLAKTFVWFCGVWFSTHSFKHFETCMLSSYQIVSTWLMSMYDWFCSQKHKQDGSSEVDHRASPAGFSLVSRTSDFQEHVPVFSDEPLNPTS